MERMWTGEIQCGWQAAVSVHLRFVVMSLKTEPVSMVMCLSLVCLAAWVQAWGRPTTGCALDCGLAKGEGGRNYQVGFVSIQGSDCNECPWSLNGGSRQAACQWVRQRSRAPATPAGGRMAGVRVLQGMSWKAGDGCFGRDRGGQWLRFGGRQGDQRSPRKQSKTNLKLNFLNNFINF